MTPGRGRPLRFLAIFLGGWIVARVAILWPSGTPPLVAALAEVRVAAAATVTAAVPTASAALMTAATAAPPRADTRVVQWLSSPTVRVQILPPRPVPFPRAAAPSVQFAAAASAPSTASPQLILRTDAPPPALAPGAPTPAIVAQPQQGRWSGSLWVLARRGGGIAPGTVGGELGGSQAGVRLAYLLDRRHRVALVGRATAPLGHGLSEAALALEWQPTRLPVRLVVEQRFAINGGRGGPGAAVVGGFGPAPLAFGFSLEGYGEAGVIRRSRSEPYADGALRAARRVFGGERVHLDVGAGVWGGAQRGAERLDVGPSASLSLPIAAAATRLSLDCGIMYQTHQGSYTRTLA